MNLRSRFYAPFICSLWLFLFFEMGQGWGQRDRTNDSLELVKLYNATDGLSWVNKQGNLNFESTVKKYSTESSSIYSSSICLTNSLNQGLIGYYKFDGSASDHSGNDKHATLFGVKNTIGNPPSFSTGIQNKALRLENFNHTGLTEVNSYAKLPPASFNSKKGFSVSFWVNYVSSAVSTANTSHGESIYTIQNCGNNTFSFEVTYNGEVFINYSKGSTYGYNSSKFNMGRNNWAYLSAVIRNDTMHFFANGTLISSTYFNRESVDLSNLDQYLGYHCWASGGKSSRFNGFIDELRVYQRGLSNTEVQQLYGSNNPICAKNNLLLYAPPGASSYSWSGPNNYGSNQQNPIKLNITSNDSGTYKCISSFGTCKDTFSTQVIIKNCLCSYRDSLDLVKLYNSTNGPSWKNRWNLQSPMDSWYGIELNLNGCVECIDLDGIVDCTSELGATGNLLKGSLPSDFGNFSALKFLHLAGNQLSGSIPKGLSNATALTQLDLNSNLFTGSIPTELGNLSNLEYLYLYNNQLSGGIPKELGQPRAMLSLFLNNNQLTGSIPSELGQLSQLKFLALNDNHLSEAMPSTLSNLKELEYLSLANNQLNGTLPATFGNFPKMQNAYLQNNQFEGAIPAEWSKCIVLKELLFQQNRFTSAPNWSTSSLPRNLMLNLSENRLTFSSIVPNRVFNLIYAPQDSIYKKDTLRLKAGETFSINLGIDASLSTNRYQWFKNGQVFGNASNSNMLSIPNVKASDAGEYRVEVSNPNAPELILYSRIIRLEVSCATSNPNAKITSSAPRDTLCPNTSFSLSASGGVTYRWSTGQTTSSISLSVTQNQSYQVTITDVAGCPTTLSKSIVQAPVPSASISNSLSSVCPGKTLTLTATPQSNTTYQWQRNGSNIGSASNQNTLQVTQGGNYSVQVRNTQGCSSSSSAVSIRDGIVPKAEISASSQIICPGGNLTLNASVSANAQYQWLRNGSSVQGPNSSASYQASQAGNYTLKVTSADGCEASSTAFMIQETAAPNAEISAPSNIVCTGGTLRLNAAIVEGAQYQWFLNGSSVQGPSNANTYESNKEGNYTVRVSLAPTCASTSAPFNVQRGGSNLRLSLSPQRDTICPGDSLHISISGGAKYSWSTGGTAASINVKPFQTTNYTVQVEDLGGCKASLSQSITVARSPQARLSILEENCSYTLTANAEGGRGPYTYRWNNGQTQALVQKAKPGLYSVQVRDRRNCVSNASISVDSFSLQTAPPERFDANCGETNGVIELKLRPERAPFLVEWSPGDQGSGENPRTGLGAGKYQATIIDGQGCMDTVLVTLNKAGDCDKDFLIYRSFSPNGDDTNERFIIQAKKTGGCPDGDLNDCYPNNELIIFNRWGEVVYRKQGYTSDWEAEGLPGGAYFFLFFPDRKEAKKGIRGALTVLK